MKNLKSISISRTLKTVNPACLFLGLILLQFFLPEDGSARIFIDINSPSVQKINIAIPDFRDFSVPKERPELSTDLPEIISNDLDLSGYFIPMDKDAFLDEDGPSLTADNIRFKNWAVIGTDLLLKGGYLCIGRRSIEVEVRLYDPLWGRQIFGKKFLGKTDQHRTLMHRIGNEIIFALTGYRGMFLSRFAFVNRTIGADKEPVKEIYVCDFDGHNVERITSDNSIALSPRWSPQGNSIVYTSYREGSPMLYMKDISTGKVRRISGRKGLNTGAGWAPDGKKLALTLSHEGNSEIYAIDPSGKILERLTNHWRIDVSPSFSPEGDGMAFVSDRSGSPQIYIKDLGNGDERRLTFPDTEGKSFEGKYNSSPSWSSRNQIAFSGDSRSGRDIYTINPDGGNLRRLTQDSGFNEDPCWSPDGRYIVFSSNRDGGFHLYIMNANGLNQRRINFLKGEQTSPSWSAF